MLITVSPGLRTHVEERGGSVYVRHRYPRGCRGVPFLEATTRPPARLGTYQLFVVDGIFVHTRLPRARRPHELTLTLAGRRRGRPVAAWDGCAFVV